MGIEESKILVCVWNKSKLNVPSSLKQQATAVSWCTLFFLQGCTCLSDCICSPSEDAGWWCEGSQQVSLESSPSRSQASEPRSGCSTPASVAEVAENALSHPAVLRCKRKGLGCLGLFCQLWQANAIGQNSTQHPPRI